MGCHLFYIMSNFLRFCYEKIWVPFFGRILFKAVTLIEGKPTTDQPTFDINKSTHRSNQKN